MVYLQSGSQPFFPSATRRQSRCGRRGHWDFIGELPTSFRHTGISRQNDQRRKNVLGDNKLLAFILAVASCFDPGRARPTGRARIGINFALKSALFSVWFGGGISHRARIPGKMMAGRKVGTPHTWIERSCRVSHWTSVSPQRVNSAAGGKH